jgi:hypothetical protein
MAENEFEAPPAPQEEEQRIAEGAPEAESAARSRKKSRRGGQAFTLLVAALGLLATGLAGAAFVLRKQDARLGAIADAIEQAARNPTNFILKEKEELGGWLAGRLPHGEEPRNAAVSAKAPAESTPASAGPQPEALPQLDAAESAPPAGEQPGWAPSSEPAPKPLAQKAEAEAAPPIPAKPAAPPPPPPPPPPVAEPPAATAKAPSDNGEIAPLVKRLEALEADVRAANDAAAEARRTAEVKAPAAGAEAPAETRESKGAIDALGARLDALAQSVTKLEAQLAQPKVETRATPDVETAARPQQAKALAALETLALAQSVQRALERGKPFSPELSALGRLGADPGALAALAPFAEKGAPRTRDLLQAFEAVGKKLRAFEDKPPPGTPLSDQLVQGAQKLVHVRPKGEAPKPTADELTPQIEKALAHDDLSAAQQAFAALPEATRAQGKEFGGLLTMRHAAENAAAQLVTGAIGDLDASKN